MYAQTRAKSHTHSTGLGPRKNESSLAAKESSRKICSQASVLHRFSEIAVFTITHVQSFTILIYPFVTANPPLTFIRADMKKYKHSASTFFFFFLLLRVSKTPYDFFCVGKYSIESIIDPRTHDGGFTQREISPSEHTRYLTLFRSLG